MTPRGDGADHRIELEFLDHVLVVAFDRPEARNAFDRAMYRAVAGALSGARRARCSVERARTLADTGAAGRTAGDGRAGDRRIQNRQGAAEHVQHCASGVVRTVKESGYVLYPGDWVPPVGCEHCRRS